MNKNTKRLQDGIESGYSHLVFRPAGEWEPLPDTNDDFVSQFGYGAEGIDGNYICVQFNDGTRFPYPLVLLPEDADEGQYELVVAARKRGVFDAAMNKMLTLRITSHDYIKQDYKDEIKSSGLLPLIVFYKLD